MPTSRRYTDSTPPVPAPASRPANRHRAATGAIPPSPTRSTFGVRSLFRRIRGISAAPAPLLAPAAGPADPAFFAHIITVAEFSSILKSFPKPALSSANKPLTNEQSTIGFSSEPDLDLIMLRSRMDISLANMASPAHTWEREESMARGDIFLPLEVWFKMYSAVNVKVARPNWGWRERMAIKLIFVQERAAFYDRHEALESYQRSVTDAAPWRDDAKKMAAAELQVRKMEEAHIAHLPAFEALRPERDSYIFQKEYVQSLRNLSIL